MVGHALEWRVTFAGVAALAAFATVGLLIGLPRGIGANASTASLRQRLDVARNPAVLTTLLTTTLWATGAYTVYTYSATFLTSVLGLSGTEVSVVMWCVAAAAGLVYGGFASDRFGPIAVIVPTITLSGIAFATLSLSADFLSPVAAILPVLGAIAAWGLAHWAFYPAQQARLIDIAGARVAPIVLSLNASFMYLGFSTGAALSAATLGHLSVGNLGWAAAAFELAALLITLATQTRRVVNVRPDLATRS